MHSPPDGHTSAFVYGVGLINLRMRIVQLDSKICISVSNGEKAEKGLKNRNEMLCCYAYYITEKFIVSGDSVVSTPTPASTSRVLYAFARLDST